jgi:hypothetical protein
MNGGARTRTRGRITIVEGMALVAIVALMAASTLHQDSMFNDLLALSLLFFLPCYFLVHLERPLAESEIAAAALALAYLAWGAAYRFQPARPPRCWTEFYALHRLYWRVEIWLGWLPSRFYRISPATMQWNWGLLAMFYAAIVTVALKRRASDRRVWSGAGEPAANESVRRTSRRFRVHAFTAVILALWSLCCWRHQVTSPTSCWRPAEPRLLARPIAARADYGSFCLLGLAGSLVAALIAWRERPAGGRPWRYGTQLVRLLRPALLGALCAPIWSLRAWGSPAVTVALFLAIFALFARLSARRPHRLTALYFLAMLWGFAMFSANILPEKYSGPPWVVSGRGPLPPTIVPPAEVTIP